MDESINRPLPMHGPANARELGGYTATDGRKTRSGVFLRADALGMLSRRDIRFLRRYPIGLIVDLRSEYETRLSPDRLGDAFAYQHVPMFDHVQSEIARRAMQRDAGDKTVEVPESLGDLYVMLAETEQEELYTALKALIDTDEPALFHCTAGKDRTGIVSMCLLEMAGVPEETIVADYAATARYLGAAYGGAVEGVPDNAYASSPEILMQLREHLNKEYGGTIGYLHHIGITDTDIERLRTKFLEPA